VLGLAAGRGPESGNPHRGIDDDHGRRRDLGMSISSLTAPIMDFNSSIRLLRISSCKESTTVSVLDLKPRRRRASSRRGSGISRVVRIQLRVNRMRAGVKNAHGGVAARRRAARGSRRRAAEERCPRSGRGIEAQGDRPVGRGRDRPRPGGSRAVWGDGRIPRGDAHPQRGNGRPQRVRGRTQWGETRTHSGRGRTHSGRGRTRWVRGRTRSGETRTHSGRGRTHSGEVRTHWVRGRTRWGRRSPRWGRGFPLDSPSFPLTMARPRRMCRPLRAWGMKGPATRG
jgi:hypothetical protein